MKLSVIIPAYNEAKVIGHCLAAVDDALKPHRRDGWTAEYVVVDNNSTDSTAEVALRAGARVVFEPVNQIARARNTGATGAGGEWLMFVDADSLVSPELMRDALRRMRAGDVVALGATMRMPGAPWWAGLMLGSWNLASRVMRWPAGSFIVVRNEVFNAVGGFNERLYAAEEIDLAQRLKKWGAEAGLGLAILRRHPLKTSARKLRLYSGKEIAGQLWRLATRPRRALADREALGMWYDGRRE